MSRTAFRRITVASLLALIGACLLAGLLSLVGMAFLPSSLTPGGRFVCDSPMPFFKNLVDNPGAERGTAQLVCLEKNGDVRPYSLGLAALVDWSAVFVPVFGILLALLMRSKRFRKER